LCFYHTVSPNLSPHCTSFGAACTDACMMIQSGEGLYAKCGPSTWSPPTVATNAGTLPATVAGSSTQRTDTLFVLFAASVPQSSYARLAQSLFDRLQSLTHS